MTQYAKYISETEIEYPQASSFAGVPHWETHDILLRRKEFVPLRGIPDERDGFQTVLDKFSFTKQTVTRIEPRREDPVTHQPFIEDVMEEDPETHEMKKVGEQQVTREVPVEFDDSYITVLEYHYEELPPEPEPEQPEDISAQLQQVRDLIMSMAEKYHAEEAIMQMEDFNIPAIEQLIEQYEVSDEDKAKISYAVNFVVLDLMGKIRMTWFDIWNDMVKPALNEMFRQRAMGAQAEEAQNP